MFTPTQKSVAFSMFIGLTVSLLMLIVGSHINLHLEAVDRFVLLGRVMIVPVFFLMVCIGRMATHRFFTPADIDGDPNKSDTPTAIEFQRVLQNTLEQTVLATIVYVMWTIAAPDQSLGTLLIAAGLFALGRILFIAFHARGATGRAMGFVLTFYPTCVLFFDAALKVLE